MSKQGIAWISADGCPVSDYLSACLLPVLSSDVNVVSFCLHGLSDIVAAKRELQSYIALYHLESGQHWQQTLALAQKIPGIIYLHDLYHLDQYSQLQTLTEEVVSSNIVVLSNSRYLVEFEKAFPSSQAHCLPLPATFSTQQKQDDTLSICSMASLNAEDAMHRLLRSLQQIEQEYVLRWLIDEHELEQAEALLAQHGVAARLYIGRTAARWRDIAAVSNYAVFLTSSAIRCCEPFALISLASGCSALFSSRIYRDSYPADAAVFVSLGLGLEQELRELFYQLPAGCMDRSVLEQYISQQRDARFVARELLTIFNNINNKETRYVSIV